jgi:hypothetical protein
MVHFTISKALKERYKTMIKTLSLTQRRELVNLGEDHPGFESLCESFESLLRNGFLAIEEIAAFAKRYPGDEELFLITYPSAAKAAAVLLIRYLEKSILPDPEKGIFIGSFYVAGTSHIADISERLSAINPGDPVQIMPEPLNPYDEKAIKVLTADGHKLGYLPKSLNRFPYQMAENGTALNGVVSECDWETDKLSIKVMFYAKADQ